MPLMLRCTPSLMVSPSSRRAWIEMTRAIRSLLMLTVALLAEGVDRNNFWGIDRDVVARVALLAEGVDRNLTKLLADKLTDVALLAEGVDRNQCLHRPICCAFQSPSSRRAWIEIRRPAGCGGPSGRRPPRGGRG